MGVRLGQIIPEAVLYRRTRDLAARRKSEIDKKRLTRFKDIVEHYQLTLSEGKLPNDKDGSWISSQRKIILNSKLSSPERRNFTFFHELMHFFIDQDDDLISDIHQSIDSPDNLIERLCNIGAAEILVPVQSIQSTIGENKFSSNVIPTLCSSQSVSAIVVGIHMATTARHACYLLIAEPANSVGNILTIRYSAKSYAAKYGISKKAEIPRSHLIYEAYTSKSFVSGQTQFFTRGNKSWPIDGDATYYKGNVYAFLHETVPMSSTQLELPLKWL
jgi:Zn-dependent peptidase ImmA (M78 family)